MSRVRLLLAGIASLLITCGYMASQYAYMNGKASEFAAQIDSAPVAMLSLTLFALAVIFLLLEDKDQEPT